jgi:hypothetical protein
MDGWCQPDTSANVVPDLSRQANPLTIHAFGPAIERPQEVPVVQNAILEGFTRAAGR